MYLQFNHYNVHLFKLMFNAAITTRGRGKGDDDDDDD